MTERDTIICVAAGESQQILINKAKEMGYRVIGVDRNPNAPGFKSCDESIVESTYNAGSIIEKLNPFASRYDFRGVITRSSGIPVITTARISKEFDLPGVEPRVAESVVFKDRLMRECNKKGIPVPKHQVVSELEQIDFEMIEYPLILKPSLSVVGKKGVRRIVDKSGLIRNFSVTKKASYNNQVDVEEFIEGQDIGLMGFSTKRKLVPFCLLDEINQFDGEGFVKQVGIMIPSKYQREMERVCEFAQNVITKLNIETSVFLMSCRYTKDGSLHLIEVHLDLGGDNILDELLPASTNSDFIELAIKVLTGKNIGNQNPVFQPTLMLIGEYADNFHLNKGEYKSGVRIFSAKKEEDLMDILKDMNII